MTVSVIPSFAAGFSRALTSQNIRVAESLRAVADAPSSPTPVAIDTGGMLFADLDPQNTQAPLRRVAQNLAQSVTLADVVTGGVEQIAKSLDHLEQLSVQASSGAVSDADREAIDTEFQATRRSIDAVVKNTKFAGNPVLDGSLKPEPRSDRPASVAVEALTERALFGDAELQVRGIERAVAAQTAVAEAKTYVARQLDAIRTASDNLQFATATVESAIQNKDAARSTLDEADFALLPQESASARLRAAVTDALLAQTNRLSPSALTLLVE